MLGIIKNGTRSKTLVPSSYPSGKVSYNNSTVKEELDRMTESSFTLAPSGTAVPDRNAIEFIAPNDGNIIVYSTNTDTVVGVAINSSVTFFLTTARATTSLNWAYGNAYLRKGMKVWVYAEGSHGFYGFAKYGS